MQNIIFIPGKESKWFNYNPFQMLTIRRAISAFTSITAVALWQHKNIMLTCCPDQCQAFYKTIKKKIQSDNNTGIAILGGSVLLELSHLLPVQVGRERGLGCLS